MALKFTSLPIVSTSEVVAITVATVSGHPTNTIADVCPSLAQVIHSSIMTIMFRQTNPGVVEIRTE